MGCPGVLHRAGGKLGAHQAPDPRGPLVGPRVPAWLGYIFRRDRNQVLIGVTGQQLLSLAVGFMVVRLSRIRTGSDRGASVTVDHPDIRGRSRTIVVRRSRPERITRVWRKAGRVEHSRVLPSRVLLNRYSWTGGSSGETCTRPPVVRRLDCDPPCTAWRKSPRYAIGRTQSSFTDCMARELVKKPSLLAVAPLLGRDRGEVAQ
jgi:hypothetical protein